MGKRVDIINVVDVEATCWKNDPPDGMVSDIIEIGICTLDLLSGTRLEKRSILVQPERSIISEFCMELTKITPKHITEGGISFPEACDYLRRNYQTRDHIWASWGDYDRRQFQNQCMGCNVPYPFGTRHINVRSLFSVLCGLHIELGLRKALDFLGLPQEGRSHSGADDAWNAAAILTCLIQRCRSMTSLK